MDNMRHWSEESLPFVMTVPQVAQLLGIGLNSAYALTRSKKIRSIRIGRQFRIPKEALLEFLSYSSTLSS